MHSVASRTHPFSSSIYPVSTSTHVLESNTSELQPVGTPLPALLKMERGNISAFEQIWFWRSDCGGILANNQLPRKTALLRQVTDEGLPAPKPRSLRRSDHRGIQANSQHPNYQKSKLAEDTTCLQISGMNDKHNLVRQPKRPRLRDTNLVPS